ncbi:PDZ domain-containing protein [Planctomycetota bacterium]
MKHITISLGILLLLTSGTLANDIPYLGILFDPTPLPELLRTHLDLDEGQGLRVQNVHLEGPADQAGIQRDDLVIELAGEPVFNVGQVVRSVGQMEIGAKTQLVVIQKGKRHAMVVRLVARPPAFVDKHPPEPVASRHIQPGKVFRFHRDQDKWVKIEPDIHMQLPDEVRPFTQELYVFHYGEAENRCTVTIQGDPYTPQTSISVKQGDMEYTTTVETREELPEPLQKKVNQALHQAQQKTLRDKKPIQSQKPHSQILKEFWEKHTTEDMDEYAREHLERAKKYFENLDKSAGAPRPMYEEDRKRLEYLEKEIETLRQRLETLEKQGRVGNDPI